MADPKLLNKIRNTQKPVEILGGSTRPSETVNLDKYPKVRLRQDVNRRLLEHSCANQDSSAARFGAEDVPILIQIAGERGAHTGNLLRNQAIQALEQFPSIEVARKLTAIADSSAEHESVRIHALTSLSRALPELGVAALVKHLTDESPLVRLSAVKRLAEVGDSKVMAHLVNSIRGEMNREVSAQAAAAIDAISKRLRVKAPQFKRVAMAKKRGTPAKDQ